MECYQWEEGSEREQCCLLGSWLAFSHFPATHKQIGPVWSWFPGGWVCVHSRTPCLPPTDSPVKLGVPLTAVTPIGLYSHRFWCFIFLALEPWFAWSVSLPRFSSQFICMRMLVHPVHQLPHCLSSSMPWLPISTPPTNLDECFFFNSLVVRLPYSSIFW